jgi:hypothetical protein
MPDNETNEGIQFALNAMAEVLNKQNATLDSINDFFSKAAEQEADYSEQEIVKSEREAIIKDTATVVIEALAEAGYLSKDLSADNAEGEDGKKTALPEKDELVGMDAKQKVIQASVSVVKDEDKDEKKEDEDEEDEKDGKYAKLEKELAELKKSMGIQVNDAVTGKLRKSGWKEEKGLVSPRQISLGADTPEIKKGMSDEEKIGEMAKLPYSTLVKMSLQSEAGQLDPAIAKLIS